jgi:hypothetical protein
MKTKLVFEIEFRGCWNIFEQRCFELTLPFEQKTLRLRLRKKLLDFSTANGTLEVRECRE